MSTMAQLNAFKQMEDTKQLNKLKALSSKFMNSRKDFITAIDRFQER